ncbi:hypothetical protein GIY56_14145 [Paracoccus sp. YIM 132242]|uniref:Copper resistance protein CopC n=1 Tax=Paracoccus lichenicola TaxID=2665644 RepID=A0A6L6HTJ3_9RHOB|nr:hypothetical protein [Paracoccus lichenicola]MTE01425.1 hypothetical protein [Paracoccus lichenicola]
MKTILISAFAALALAAPAVAEVAVLSAPFQAASLHAGALDMAAYRTDLPDGAHEVTAMFRGRGNQEPQRVVMRLDGQDEVQFSMPGEPQTLYTFADKGDVVEISAQGAAVQLATR